MTYPRLPYWPASANYYLAPDGRGIDSRLVQVPIPPELWGDLPGTPAYPLPREFREAGQVPLTRGLVAGEPPGDLLALPAPPWTYEEQPGTVIPGFEWGPFAIPPTPIPGSAVPGIVPPPPPPPMKHLPIPGQPRKPAEPAVPPPTTIPTTPAEPAKKPIPTAWVIGGALVAAVALGAIVYIAAKPSRKRNPRRRRRRNPSRRRRRARRRNPYAADARGTVHYFPEESSRREWLARAPSKKSRRVKGSTRRVRAAKKRGAVVRHRKAKGKKKKRPNPWEVAWYNGAMWVPVRIGGKPAVVDSELAAEELMSRFAHQGAKGVKRDFTRKRPTHTMSGWGEFKPATTKKKNPRCSKSTKVQTLVFSKDQFNASQARAWARSHGYKAPKVDATANAYRLRQEAPKAFRRGGFRTIPLAPGVQGVIGCPR